jgi:HAD superfamily phosphatase
VSHVLRDARAILFDMDGVLVDTGSSYHQTIVQTALRLSAEWGLVGPSASIAWVTSLKRAGGFNNDWDLTTALLRGLAHLGETFDADHWGASLAAAGGGLGAVDHLLGPTAEARFSATGVIRDVFQALYLGQSLYRTIEGREPPVYVTTGLIDSERALIGAPLLQSLAVPKAVATGRPRAEARHALETFGLVGCFGALVTHDDCVEAGQRGKPDPWCVRQAAHRIGVATGADVWYVGDTVDDIRAALAAGCSAAGVATDAADQARLLAAGATCVAQSVTALFEV